MNGAVHGQLDLEVIFSSAKKPKEHLVLKNFQAKNFIMKKYPKNTLSFEHYNLHGSCGIKGYIS
jgi:hypothetical protein